VVDLRRSEPQGETQGGRVGRGPQEQASRQTGTDGSEKNLGVLLRGASDNPAMTAERVQASRGGDSLRSFQERVVPEMVRQIGIILKEGNTGEIRLVLRPEHLGQVRVRLSLGESSLEGRIVVENNSVKELLEAGLDSLKNALRQEGFQTASLDVSVGNHRSWEEAAATPGPEEVGRARHVSDEFDRAVPVVVDWGAGSGLVNIYA
jgi:flagellar hook-length control protein FliK